MGHICCSEYIRCWCCLPVVRQVGTLPLRLSQLLRHRRLRAPVITSYFCLPHLAFEAVFLRRYTHSISFGISFWNDFVWAVDIFAQFGPGFALLASYPLDSCHNRNPVIPLQHRGYRLGFSASAGITHCLTKQHLLLRFITGWEPAFTLVGSLFYGLWRRSGRQNADELPFRLKMCCSPCNPCNVPGGMQEYVHMRKSVCMGGEWTGG